MERGSHRNLQVLVHAPLPSNHGRCWTFAAAGHQCLPLLVVLVRHLFIWSWLVASWRSHLLSMGALCCPVGLVDPLPTRWTLWPLPHHIPQAPQRHTRPPTMPLNDTHTTGPTQTRVRPHHTSGCPSNVPKSPTRPTWPHACMPTTTNHLTPSQHAMDAPDPQQCASMMPHATGPTQTCVWSHHTSGRPSDVPTIAMGSHNGCKTNIKLGDIISNLSACYPGQPTLITHLTMFLSTTAPLFIHIHMLFTPWRATALVGATLHATHTQYAHLQPIQSGICVCRAERTW